ncbi:hypothetical protein V502_10933 [Pseudogymnoascus sp. VKM F-4520 (FW-2644)]|nr:hypothetical protein V502_10933 [Pseudogymnoascus sp. VKM F-4520 (FW-2644)]
MSSNLSGDGDFTLDETEALEVADIFRARTGPGERKVSKVALSVFWNTANFSSYFSNGPDFLPSIFAPGATAGFMGPGSFAMPMPAISATAGFIGHDRGQKRQGSFVMPTAVISAEALEYIGFIPLTATYIFYEFKNRLDPDNNPYTLMDFATCYVERIYSLRKGNHTPDQAMIQVGLDKDFRKQVLVGLNEDEDFRERDQVSLDKDFRERKPYPDLKTFITECLMERVLRGLGMSNERLKGIHERLKHRAREILALCPD